ncbi:MAG: MFS transporter [Anaerolineae bacterium]|nr:MFS transporter [Anaerolineae bacterium]
MANTTTTNAQRWLYSIANLGNTIPSQAVSAFMLFFYTDVRHLPAEWAATAMFVYAIYDALNNPVLGYLSDRTKTRWGRRIPYIMFGAAPYAIVFALLWMTPFDGISRPVPLLIYFVVASWLWEGLSTAVSTGYYSLLPEMFTTYGERTDVAVRMNVVQVVGLLIGVAVPPLLYNSLGWPAMGLIFSAIVIAAVYTGLRGMFEHPESVAARSIPFGTALKATFVNRSFITVVIAQTFRFFGTNALLAGTAFYTKYSLKAGDTITSVILATAFVSAGIALWFWRRFVAQRFEARTTLMIANGVMALAVIPLALAQTTVGVVIASVLLGIGLAGLILMGDVIVADVIDEDEIKTGQRREGMYFGMSKFIITLSSSLVAVVFGWITAVYGYDSTLSVQPETVGTGFRIFMSVPVIVGSILAIVTLLFYPLHGERLRAVKAQLGRENKTP